jgi:hypothetical protein
MTDAAVLIAAWPNGLAAAISVAAIALRSPRS